MLGLSDKPLELVGDEVIIAANFFTHLCGIGKFLVQGGHRFQGKRVRMWLGISIIRVFA